MTIEAQLGFHHSHGTSALWSALRSAEVWSASVINFCQGWYDAPRIKTMLLFCGECCRLRKCVGEWICQCRCPLGTSSFNLTSLPDYAWLSWLRAAQARAGWHVGIGGAGSITSNDIKCFNQHSLDISIMIYFGYPLAKNNHSFVGDHYTW